MRKKEKNRGKFFSIFIVVIMSMSILGFLIGSGGDSQQKLKYNGINFIRSGDNWIVSVSNTQLIFDYFPEEVEYIIISSELVDRIGTLQVDLTYDINDSFKDAIALSIYSLQQNIGAVSNAYLRQGLTTDNEFNLPVITCDDATEFVPVMYFKQSNETKVYLENDCIIIEADSEIDFLRVKDRLLYGYFDIIK